MSELDFTDEDWDWAYADDLLSDLDITPTGPQLQIAKEWFRKARVENALRAAKQTDTPQTQPDRIQYLSPNWNPDDYPKSELDEPPYCACGVHKNNCTYPYSPCENAAYPQTQSEEG